MHAEHGACCCNTHNHKRYVVQNALPLRIRASHTASPGRCLNTNKLEQAERTATCSTAGRSCTTQRPSVADMLTH